MKRYPSTTGARAGGWHKGGLLRVAQLGLGVQTGEISSSPSSAAAEGEYAQERDTGDTEGCWLRNGVVAANRIQEDVAGGAVTARYL